MHKKRVIQSLALGMASEGVNKIVPLLILFFVVRRLGLEHFGYAQFGFWLIDVAIFFIVFGYHHSAAIDIGRLSNDRNKIREIVGEVLACKSFNAGLSVILISCVVLFIPSYQKYQLIAFSLFFLLITSTLDMNFLHLGTQRLRSWSAILIVVKVLSLIAVLIFVNDSDDAVLYAVLTLGANGVVSCIALIYNREYLPVRLPTSTELKSRFVKSLPTAIYILFLTTLERVDIFFVEAFSPMDQLGVYSGNVRLVMAVIPVIVMLTSVFFSEGVAAPTRESLTRHLRLAATVTFSIVMPIGICTWFIDKELIGFLLGEKFTVASTAFSTLNLSLIPYALVALCGFQTLMVAGKYKQLNLSLFIGVLVTVICSLTVGKALGLTGFAVSSLAGKTTASILLLYFARQQVSELPWRAVTNTALPVIATVGVLIFLPNWSIVVKLIIASLIYGSIMAYLNRRFLSDIKESLKGRMTPS